MQKLDFKKIDKSFYSGKQHKWVRLQIPQMLFLTINGMGAPGGNEYIKSIAALYPLAYGLKFLEKASDKDFVVPPLEAIWWADDKDAFVKDDRDNWQWQLRIRMPDEISQSSLNEIRQNAILKNNKKKDAPTDEAHLNSVNLEFITEGDCLQCLHKGPFADEAPVLHALHHDLMPNMGLTFNGDHHEIYLSDPRKTAPEKLKTILRQPIKEISN